MDYRQNNLKHEYLKQSVMTASPIDLLIMLFDSCIKNLRLAEICLTGRNDIAGAGEHFMKAQKIIMELTNCLDTRFEISVELMRIYEYLLFAIREVNAKKDLTRLPDILDILISCRDTWQQLKSSSVCSSEVS